MTKLVSNRLSDKKREELAEGLSRAALLIEKKGWCTGAMVDDSGRICMMGAVRDAFLYSSRDQKYRAYDIVNKALRADMTEWNDRHTEEDVIVMLRRIAEQVDPEVPMFEVCEHGTRLCSGCDKPIGCEDCAEKKRKDFGYPSFINLSISHTLECRRRNLD